jgi:hypothetical protein
VAFALRAKFCVARAHEPALTYYVLTISNRRKRDL